MSRESRNGLGTAVILAAAFFLVMMVAARRAPTPPRAPEPPQRPSPPKPAQYPPMPQTLVGEAWRTDGNFVAKIHIQNVLAVAALDVTVTLYMADGTPYQLPAITIPKSGEADVNISQALAGAPGSLLGHTSTFGSATLSYVWNSPGHLAAVIENKDVPDSLIITNSFEPAPMAAPEQKLAASMRRMEQSAPFHLAMPSGMPSGMTTAPSGTAMPPMAWIEQGLWWRHDKGVQATLALANAGPVSTSGRWRLSSAKGAEGPWNNIELGPHSTSEVSLDAAIDALPPRLRQAGGVEVQELEAPDMPASGNLLVAGWLINPGNGFSADMNFTMTMNSKPAPMTFAAPGMMLGAPMARDHFPDGIRFHPYGYLRNATARPLEVTLTAALGMPMGRSAAPAAASHAIELGPGETRRIGLAAWAHRLQRGPAPPGESLNWSASFEGAPGDLVMTAGSVDRSGSYVFQVMPQKVGVSAGEQLPYWTTVGGNNTMYSLWNPTGSEQDLVLMLTPADGTNAYEMAISLAPGASTMVDVGMLRAEGMPDRKGNLLPAEANSGSAMLEPAGIPAPNRQGVIIMPKSGIPVMTVAVSTGVFNAQEATCSVYCGRCCAYGNQVVTTSASTINQGQTFSAEYWAVNCDGHSVDLTNTANWGGALGATFDGYDAYGDPLFTGSSPGQVEAWADIPNVIQNPGSGYPCSCGCWSSDFFGSADVTVDPVITGPTDFWWFGGVNPSGYATSVTLSASSGSGYQWSVDSNPGEVDTSSLTGSSLTVTASGGPLTAATVAVSVVVNGARSGEFYLQPHEPYKLSALGPLDYADSTYGYRSFVQYDILDQTGAPMPSPIPLHEEWCSSTVEDYSGTNWGWGLAGGATTAATTPDYFTD
ncbi:MAG: hypothetical protein EPN33_04050 [Acidobacteria bacterium]|nr:MAG: hypothetical protein EPN33_04050 [Acidobacteriota bacterium]